MGQRSQIYVAWEKENGERELIARYFQWNYGNRMISRAAGIINCLFENLKYSFEFQSDSFKQKIKQMAETNFDYCDITLSSDIIQEYKETGNKDNFSEFVFTSQDNNDGQFYCFVDLKNKKIKYGFVRYTASNCDNDILSAKEYIEPYKPYFTEYEAKFTKENLALINEKAELISDHELSEFVNFDYDIKPNKPKIDYQLIAVNSILERVEAIGEVETAKELIKRYDLNEAEIISLDCITHKSILTAISELNKEAYEKIKGKAI